MYFASFLAFSAWVLNVIVIITTNNGNKVTKHLSWGWGDCDAATGCNKVFIGIWNYVVDMPEGAGDDMSISFTSSACKASLPDDVCNDCSDAQRVAITFASIGLALFTIGLFVNILRMKINGNTFTNKVVGVVTAALGIAAGMVSVISFDKGCFENIQDEQEDFDWWYGPAFIILVVAIIIKAVELILLAISTVGGEVATSAPAGENAVVATQETQNAV